MVVRHFVWLPVVPAPGTNPSKVIDLISRRKVVHRQHLVLRFRHYRRRGNDAPKIQV
jgi:hypothetical protein